MGGWSFRGTAILNLDDKGRLAIPARQREVLLRGDCSRVVVTAHPHPCLLIYPEPTFIEVEATLVGMPASEEVALLQHLLIGHANDCEPDAQGRIPLMPAQREFARLDKRVALVGVGNRMEVWDEGAWQARQQAMRSMTLTQLANSPATAGFTF